jgi:hypothetical protein
LRNSIEMTISGFYCTWTGSISDSGMQASAKRFSVTGSGKITRRCAGRAHLLRKKTTTRKNRLSGKVREIGVCYVVGMAAGGVFVVS